MALTEAEPDGFSRKFYEEEWDQIVQDQDIDERDAYLTVKRTGRGTRLSRVQRVQIWAVLSRYRQLMQDAGLVEWPDVVRETRLYIERHKADVGYRAVLADEVQDFTTGELRLLRAIAPQAPDSLFLVGDAHQRIYGWPVRLSSCGIDIRGRSRRLKLNYRTTEEIRNRAVAVLEGKAIDDLDGERDTLKGYRSLRRGAAPEIRHFDRENEEAAFILEKIRQWLDQGVAAESICIGVRTRALLRDRYQPLLIGAGIECLVVEGDRDAEANKPGVRLATMHRMKGLEFSRVLLTSVQQGTVPLGVDEFPDEASRAEHELQERFLFYVGATRARDELVITGFGERSPLL